MSETMRNHISVILGNSLRGVFLLVLMIVVFSTGEEMPPEVVTTMSYLFTGLAAVIVAVCTIFWYRTTYEFTDSEIIIHVDTVFRKTKRIQYSKLASVNVHRGIVDKIFGTTTLLFNVNSSVNSNMAEGRLCLKSDEADKIRNELSGRIFGKPVEIEEEKSIESMVEVSNSDVILHGLFGQTTIGFLTGLASIITTIVAYMFDSGSGVLVSVLIFLTTTGIQWIALVLKYANYRIYRIGDTITIESGLIRNYRSSFKINKINSVRIRRPLFARLIGKSILEAEVVGLAGDDKIPLLCPLKDDATVVRLFSEIVPEFRFENDVKHQPSRATVPTFFWNWLSAAVMIMAAVLGTYAAYMFTEVDSKDVLTLTIVDAVLIALAAILFIRPFLAQRVRCMDADDELFMFAYGSYDLVHEYIRFDKVQMCTVSAGPLCRTFGVASCSVGLMSSLGPRYISSGIFDPDDLEHIPCEVMSRIRDGRYDYRRYY